MDATSGRLLYGDKRELILVGVAQSSSEGADPSPTDTLSLGLTQAQLIGVIAGVIAVIIIIIVVLVVVFRRKKSTNSESSSTSGEKQAENLAY
jgi:heme/copper-type cytochrome/quinol oxidase subunit 2